MRCFVLFFSSFFWFFQKQNSQKMELVWQFFWSSIKKNVPTTNARELHLCCYRSHVPLSHVSVCCYRLATVQWIKLHLTVCWRAPKRSSLQRTCSSSGFAFLKKKISHGCVFCFACRVTSLSSDALCWSCCEQFEQLTQVIVICSLIHTQIDSRGERLFFNRRALWHVQSSF